MKTITLHLSDAITQKVLNYLATFPRNQVKVLNDNTIIEKSRNEDVEEYVSNNNKKIKPISNEIADMNQKSKKSFTDFCGVLSDEDYQDLKNHTEKSREEWS